jgi:hypothetical protein
MMLGPIAFLSPWLLAGLLALPLIWWLLRAIPPRPQRIAFPPTRILVGLENREKTPAKTPWWLTLIRMAAAALVILALAEPVLNPNRETALAGSGPVVLVVDNGWPAAANWQQRTYMIERLINEAEAQSRPVMIVPTASATKTVSLRVEAPTAARSTAAAMQPQPFAPDRPTVAKAIAGALGGATGSAAGTSIVWLADGVDHDDNARAFGDSLKGLASSGLAVVTTTPGQEALGASATVAGGGRLEAQVLRADGAGPRSGTLHALSGRGQRLGSAPFALAAGETRAVASFELPLELRNQVTRIEIDGERSAGAVHLLDARSRWHRVGLYASGSLEQAQPLLAPLYYIERALAPFTELAKSDVVNLPEAVEAILKRNVSVLVLADIGVLPPDVHEHLAEWVRKGGILIRFAGPRLEKGGDDLLPVALRQGGRTLGGALSWASPQPLAPFGEESLFAGLTIAPEVLVTRQVLADPAALTSDVKVWARLKDGTPLVTAAQRGDGQVVFFHVTANSDWSNLPLSGLFVEMLRRVTSLGRLGGAPEGSAGADVQGAAEGATADVLSPLQVLDGFGLLKSPPPTTQGIAASKIAGARPDAENPPGYYGPAGAPRALNLLTPKSLLKPLPGLPAGAERRVYEGNTAQPLKAQLLLAAMALLFADMLAVLLLQAGGFAFLRRRAARAAAVLAVAVLGAGATLVLSAAPASAQAGSQAAPTARADLMALKATSKVTFGYVVTGDAGADDASRRGLIGLARELTRRTAVEPGEPFAVNIETDEITFFPVIYWPVLPNARPLSPAVLAKIDAYMKQGGMIIFDTRDYGQGVPTGYNLRGDGSTPLQRMLGNLDVPRLEPVPEHHVLTKSFYLLRTFPGRFEGGSLWVEAEMPRDSDQGRQARRVDGVSSILITSNDLASAWAIDDGGRPIYPVVPGGERQREMAFRVGINIVMYVLTGNYKADQVHVPALLERLGQ